MRNITVAIPDRVYIQARSWSAHQNISLSASVRIILQELMTFAGPPMRARMTDRERTLAVYKAAKIAKVSLKKPETPPPANSANPASDGLREPAQSTPDKAAS